MTSPSLETLTPEVQAQIMRNIASVPTFISLLRASPRFYQVFRDRRNYLLTQLAFNQFHPDIHDDVWTLAKALQFPQPATIDDIYQQIRQFKLVDDDYRHASIPAATIVPLCRIGPTIAWFVEHYRQSSLEVLANLGTQMGLQQDTQTLQSDLFMAERGRLQRAFCRFQTFCCLFAAPQGQECNHEYSHQARHYLCIYTLDEVEELVCIRDYLVRHLWGIFEAMEEQAMQAGAEDAIHKLANACRPWNWFSREAKRYHPSYMDHLMSLGLLFLYELLQSDGLKRAEIVMTNSSPRENFISDAVFNDLDKFYHTDEYDNGFYNGEGEYIGDEVDSLSQGLLWAHDYKIPTDFARASFKGHRDWGYVFWHKDRLQAAGVLAQK
ncbi:MAG: hypothetical protein Q9172_003700 [Xanthocarpia lactea]